MKQRVVIIGAGLAGLTAAYELSKSENYEIIVLESEATTGGRISTGSSNGTKVDLGGFMVFPWYKYFKKILKENDLLDELRFTNSKVQFYQPGLGEPYKKFNETPIHKLFPLRLLSSLVLPFILGKLHYYEPDLNYFGNKTVGGYLRKYLGPNSATEALINSYITAYTYENINKIPVALYIGFGYKLFLTKGFDKFKYLPGGTERLIVALESKIRSNGGVIMTNTKVISVNKNVITTNNSKIEADNIVFANGLHDGLVEKCIPSLEKLRDAHYTDNYAVIIETEHIAAINGTSDWMVAYNFNDSTFTPHIVSIGNLGASLGYKRNILVFYLRINELDQTKYSSEQIAHVAKKELAKYLPDPSSFEITDVHHWRYTMPVVSTAIIKAIRAAQGKNGYYFAGDYLGSPSMETAAYSGIKAAKLITSKKQT